MSGGSVAGCTFYKRKTSVAQFTDAFLIKDLLCPDPRAPPQTTLVRSAGSRRISHVKPVGVNNLLTLCHALIFRYSYVNACVFPFRIKREPTSYTNETDSVVRRLPSSRRVSTRSRSKTNRLKGFYRRICVRRDELRSWRMHARLIFALTARRRGRVGDFLIEFNYSLGRWNTLRANNNDNENKPFDFSTDPQEEITERVGPYYGRVIAVLRFPPGNKTKQISMSKHYWHKSLHARINTLARTSWAATTAGPAQSKWH